MKKKISKIASAGLLSLILLVGLVESSLGQANKNLLEKEAIEELVRQGQYQKLIEIYERTIPNLKNDRKGTAYYNLALAYNKIGNNSRAIANLKKASDYLKKSEDVLNYIRADLFLSQLKIQEGLTSNITVRLKTAIDIAKNNNYSSLTAKGTGILGNFYLKSRSFNKAIEQYKESVKIKRNPNTFIQLSKAYYEKAKVENELEDFKIGYNRAVKAIKLSQTTRQKINSKLSILKYYENNLTKEQIEQYKTRAIELINLLPNENFKANKLIAIAKLSTHTAAIEYLERGRKIAEELGSQYAEAIANEELGKIYLDLDRLNLAKEYTDRALLISQAIPSPERSFYQSWQLAKISLVKGDKQSAIASYNLAFSQLNSQHGEFLFGPNLLFHLQDDARLFLREYITVLLESNQPEKAIAILPTLKLQEFQDYFDDPCFDLKANFQNQKPEIKTSSTNIYTFVTPEKLYLIAKNNNKYAIETVNIPGTVLSEKITRYLKSEITGSTDSSFVNSSKELYNIFIEPLEKHIPNSTTSLRISNDGITGTIPWETFLDSKNNYLIEKYSIRNTPGLSDTSIEIKPNERIIFALTKTKDVNRPPLIFGEEEVKAISRQIKVLSFLGEEFTKNNLAKTIDQKSIQWLHIATHGSFRGAAENSYLESFDGLISLNDFKNFLLTAKEPIELLVLSGCETAIGNSRAALGFSGVAVRARIPYVLGSLWNIPDDTKLVEFMDIFYQELERGKPPEDAKRTAQIKIIRDGDLPRFWAGIILIEN